jgi:uncharacterized delta-60 repeat protein
MVFSLHFATLFGIVCFSSKILMSFKFTRFWLPAVCRDCLSMGVCAVLGYLLGSTATAAPGQLDPTFGSGGTSIIPVTPRTDSAYAVAIQPDGKLVLTGDCQMVQSTRWELCLARLLADGTPDPTFGNAGTMRTALSGDAHANAVLVMSDGKIVIAGVCQPSGIRTSCLASYDASGRLDPAFGVAGKVDPIANFPDISTFQLIETTNNKLLIIGHCFSSATGVSFCVARLNRDGSLDATYGSDGTGRPVVVSISGGADYARRDYARHGFVQANGKLVISGYCGDWVYGGDLCAARLDADGRLDTTFGTLGKLRTPFAGIQLDATYASEQPDNKLVFATHCIRSADGQTGLCLVRTLPDGTPDISFGQSGFVSAFVGRAINPPVASVTKADNTYFVLWQCETSNGFCVARFSDDGTPDATFGLEGLAAYRIGLGLSYATAIAITPNGKAVAVGYCDNYQVVIPGIYSVYLGLEFCASRLKGGPYDPLTCALNVDANQTIGFTTDGVLITRYLLGLRGALLTNGALGQNPTRTGQALEDHLASLNLDADGDGQALAMTDGLLMLRAMLGLTGDALTAGATNAAHPNVRNAQQILTSIEQTHGVACLP